MNAKPGRNVLIRHEQGKRIRLTGGTVVLGLALCSCAYAGKLTNTFNMPVMEGSVADSCVAGSISVTGNMTARRKWTGPSSGQDSVVNQAPGSFVSMTTTLPNGTYTVTVDVRDSSGQWSCPVSATSVVKGNRPSRVSSLGWSPTLGRVYGLMAMLEETRKRWLYRM